MDGFEYKPFLLGPGLFSGAKNWLVSGRVMGMFGAFFFGLLGLEDSFGIQTTEPQTNSSVGFPFPQAIFDNPDISKG